MTALSEADLMFLEPSEIVAVADAEHAAEEGLEEYVLSSFSFHNPALGISNNQANRKLLREKLREKGFFRFTEAGIDQLLKDELGFLDSLARTPFKENIVRVEADLRKELIQKLTEAGASEEFFKRSEVDNRPTGPRWVDVRPIRELEDLLQRIEARAKYKLMNTKTLRQVARQENAARHPESQYQPLPATVVRFSLKTLGFEFPKDPQELPDGMPFNKIVIEKLIRWGQYERLKRVYGLDQVNARLRGEI